MLNEKDQIYLGADCLCVKSGRVGEPGGGDHSKDGGQREQFLSME
jgi:hypothetical protein